MHNNKLLLEANTNIYRIFLTFVIVINITNNLANNSKHRGKNNTYVLCTSCVSKFHSNKYVAIYESLVTHALYCHIFEM